MPQRALNKASRLHNGADGKLYYRGRDVSNLAEKASLEQVAELLWEAEGAERERLFERLFEQQPGREWRDAIEAVAAIQSARARLKSLRGKSALEQRDDICDDQHR